MKKLFFILIYTVSSRTRCGIQKYKKYWIPAFAGMTMLICLALPGRVFAATEFVSIVDTGGASDSDYSSLSTWELGLGTNLTAPSTLVFSGVVTGTAPIDGSSVTLYRGGASVGVGATVVHTAKTGTKILLKNVSDPAYGFTTGDEWRINATNLFTIDATAPDQPQVTAKCRATTGTADTSAVTIDGWDTDATHYIKIWTDPSENYRHQGKWDTGKYRLEITSNTHIINIGEENVRIDGLQFLMSQSSYSNLAAVRDNAGGVGEIQISNNIIKASLSGSVTDEIGVQISGNSNQIIKLYNNIIYGFSNANTGYGIYMSNGTAYIYNNTEVNNDKGVWINGGTAIFKNNLAYNNADNYLGDPPGPSSANNLSGPSSDSYIASTTAPRNGVTVTFADSANNDFHLDSSDTGAKNQGIILYDSGDDSNLNFTTDIDNEARKDVAGSWDIGADENVAKIYRSVGAGATSPLAWGGTADSSYGNMTISGLIATFWRPLPDNVGVGDALQYDQDNTGGIDKIVFITKRIDSTHYSVRKADGTAPDATTSLPNSGWGIYRAYDRLSRAESGTENTGIADAVENFDTGDVNLTTNNLQWNIACYANGTTADSTAVTISGWTTTADNYMRIYTPTRTDEVGTSQRHAGKWDDTKYKLEVVSVTAASLDIEDDYIRVEGLQVSVDPTNGTTATGVIYAGITTTLTTTDIRISNSILKKSGSNNAQYQNGFAATSGSLIKIWNNIFYDFTGSTEGRGILCAGPATTMYVYNNSINNTQYGIKTNNGYPLVAKNNIIQNSSTSGYFSEGSGSFSSTSTNNLSDHADAPGLNPQNTKTVSFVDATNKDFHLAPGDSVARNIGADLANDPYLPIQTDIDSSGSIDGKSCDAVYKDSCYTRPGPAPAGAGFDIGADELITKIYRSVGVGTTAAIISGTSTVISLTISGNTGTFATWPTSADFGVGDVIRYDSDNNGSVDSTAFISAIDSTAKTATLQNSTGGTAPQMAVGDFDWKLYRAYTSLSAWESGTENTGIGVTYDSGDRDIAINSEQWNVACYANSGTAPDTTAVTISGWTTAQQNYIKVYTPTLSSEATTSQRHQGKWDDTKYRLDVTNGNGLYVSNNYVRIDGLQVRSLNPSAGGTAGVYITYSSSANDAYVSNNIIRGSNSVSYQQYGIVLLDPTNYTTGKIWNNIIYDLGTVYSTIGISMPYGSKSYAYNNTIYGGWVGVYVESGRTLVVKNNICSGASYVNYFAIGTFDSSSDYNISSDATAPGSHSKNSTTVTFADEANSDFHLATTDTAAKDAGADLSQDLYLLITTDIDSQTRRGLLRSQGLALGLGTDIGADESATAIYRSLAPSATGSIASGTSPANSMIIAGTSVTFGTAPGDTIGVGDAIQYDSDNNGTVDSIAFISSRTSSTVYIVQDRTGASPVPTTATDYDWSIFRAYTSLQNATGSSTGGAENTGIADAVEHFDIDWSASHGKNIYTNNQQWNVSAYANSTTADSTATTISGWTTYPTNYIRVYTPTAITEVGTSQRHQGTSVSGYKLNKTSGQWSDVLLISADYARIDGLIITTSGNYNNKIRYTGKGELQISNSIVYDSASNKYFGINLADAGSGSIMKIWNNIVYDCGNYGGISNAWPTGSNLTSIIYNNTINNCGSVNFGALAVYGFSGTSYIKNNIVQGNSGTDSNYWISVTGTSVTSNNISSDATSPNSGGTDCGGHSCRSQTVTFADSANKDFHLGIGDTAARNSGADLSADSYLPITTDIDGHTRPTGTNVVDIGADEGATGIYYSVGQSTSTDFKVASNVSISGYTATFDTAQTGNIGVGDIVTYTGGSCNITGKTSTSIWSCSNVTGGTAPQVSGVSVTSIKRAFASLNSAMGGSTAPQFLNTTDLKTNNYQLNIPCYMDSGTQPDTTAVTVSGYTTAQPNYIKIYTPSNTTTEANQSQRHQGKWDDTKYSLQASGHWRNVLYVANFYIRIEGLQVAKTSGDSSNGIISLSMDSSNYSQVSHSIVKMIGGDLAEGIIVRSESPKIYNNIVYNCGTGINIWYSDSASVYNNTAYNNVTGFANAYPVINNSFKNNLSYNNTTDYSGYAPDSSSSNNLSKDATSPNSGGTDCGGHSCRSQTVVFQDAANNDFHLASTDTAARNSGANLSADSNFAFSTDIDGNTRNLNSRGWDIGADESATAIYYSVGQSSSDLKTGSPTLSIDASGNGTLSVAQTGNMGVGDYIEYGTAPYAKAYIIGKTSTTVWTVQSATGSMLGIATTEPVNSIKHAYTTLNGAIAGASGATMMNTTDLYTNNLQLSVPCYMDSGTADTTAVTISGYTTYSTNYIKVYTPTSTTAEANNSQRHSGKWDEGKYRLESAGQALAVYANYTKIDGLQIKLTSTEGSHSGIYISVEQGRNAYVANNIIKGVGGGYGIMQYSSNLGMGYIYNNIIYNFTWGLYSNNAYVNNNTLVNNSLGGICCNNWQIIVRNNIVQGSQDGYVVSNSSDYNISDIAGDSPGAHSKNSATVSFVDSANYDFHLAESDSSARNSGADLSADSNLPVTSDIDGNTRPTGSNVVDIGADEGATYIYYSVGQNTSDHKTLGVGGSAPTITLSGYSATLNVGQTAPNMGVGDLITYTGGSCYITSKTNDDKMHWNCQNATGGTAPQVTDASVTTIAHAFGVLGGNSDSGALSANAGQGAKNSSHLNTSDLYSGNYVLNIPCYYDTGADTAALNVQNWITAQNNYIKVYTPTNTSTEANSSQRHSGKWDTSKYYISIINSGMYIYANHFWIDGIQLKVLGNDSGWPVMIEINGLSAGNNNIKISNNIFQADYSGLVTYGGNALNTSWGNQNVLSIWNNIFYDSVKSTHFGGLYITGGTSYVYNNTFANLNGGIYAGGGTVIAKNNLVQNSDTGYSGSYSSSSVNNLSDHADAPGSNPQNSKTVSFISTADKNFHLSLSDTAAKNAGIKLASYSDDSNLNFQTDIDGNSRTGSWSIGADDGPYAEAQSDLSTSKEESPNLDINDGLVGYWSFNGKDINVGGTAAYDRSGNNNTGTIVGATPTVGKLGQGMRFDGTDDYASVPTLNYNSSTITVSFWFNFASFNKGIIFESSSNFNINNNTWAIYDDWPSSNQITAAIQSGGGNYRLQYISLPTTNTWHHLTVILDNSTTTGNISFFMDGQEQSSTIFLNNKSGSGNFATQPLYFMARVGVIHHPGIIDEVRVYNRALSEAEIGNLYRMGQDTLNSSQAGKNTSGLVGHWTFDGPNVNIGATAAYDSSGNNYTGKIVGATPTMGKLGQGMNFDGSSSYISVPNESNFDFDRNNPFTISAWVNYSGASSTAGEIFSKIQNSGNFPGYQFAIDVLNQRLQAYILGTGGDNISANASISTISPNVWHYVVLTYDGSSSGSGLFFYTDGSSVASTKGGTLTTSTLNDVLPNIGRDTSATNYLKAAIDDVRIYNRALSADEIGDLYRLGHAVIKE